MALARKWLRERESYLIGQDVGLTDISEIRGKYNELVAAQATDGRRGELFERFSQIDDRRCDPDALFEASSHILQKRIANGVAKIIVDAFETVQIQVENGNNAALFLGVIKGSRRISLEQLAIRQASQGVIVSKTPNARLSSLAVRGIANDYQNGFV